MPRTARLVVPNMPHHIIQRGNRKQDVFFSNDDYRQYLSLLTKYCENAGTEILAYCLMPNHVHLILQPQDQDGLRAIGEAHRLYTRHINRKMDWQGYLWQGRFRSYPMDDAYLYRALRYVELNPVKAGLCSSPQEYRWSSARQRIEDNNHDLSVAPSLKIEDWPSYWKEGLAREEEAKAIEENEKFLHSKINN